MGFGDSVFLEFSWSCFSLGLSLFLYIKLQHQVVSFVQVIIFIFAFIKLQIFHLDGLAWVFSYLDGCLLIFIMVCQIYFLLCFILFSVLMALQVHLVCFFHSFVVLHQLGFCFLQVLWSCSLEVLFIPFSMVLPEAKVFFICFLSTRLH